jgi:hypothetical protein
MWTSTVFASMPATALLLTHPLVARITWRPVIPRQLDQAGSGLGGTQPLAQQLGRDFGRARNDGQRHTLVRQFERDRIEG